MATDYNKDAVRLIEPWVNKKIEDAVASALASGGAIETAISAKVDAAVAAHEAKEESATFANSHVVAPTPPAPSPTITRCCFDENNPEELAIWKKEGTANLIIGTNFNETTKVLLKENGESGEFAQIDSSKVTFVGATKLSVNCDNLVLADSIDIKVANGDVASDIYDNVAYGSYP